MTETNGLDYDRAARRIGRFMSVIAALGTIATLTMLGWKWGAGFLVGAIFSGLNYRWLRGLVEGLGEGKAPRGAVFLAFRYLLLGGGGYVILRYSSINMVAVLTGLFVLIAAVFVELIFEIVYGK